MTPLQQHVADWRDCKRCSLHKGRQQVVFVRGQIPCQVIMVGEAPGDSEDALGRPFVGPAGHLLDRIVRKALVLAFGTQDSPPRMAFGNLVGCFPREAKEAGTNEPPDEAIKACAPRLQQLVKLCNPDLLVCLGNLARDWLDPKRKGSVRLHKEVRQVHVVHPASILRANEILRATFEQRAVVTLADALEGLR